MESLLTPKAALPLGGVLLGPPNTIFEEGLSDDNKAKESPEEKEDVCLFRHMSFDTFILWKLDDLGVRVRVLDAKHPPLPAMETIVALVAV